MFGINRETSGEHGVNGSRAQHAHCLNRVRLIGRLTADPICRQTKRGVPVTRFHVATNTYSGAQFHSVVAWSALATCVAETAHKGQMVTVDGSLEHRKWTDRNGVVHSIVDIVVDDFDPMLD